MKKYIYHYLIGLLALSLVACQSEDEKEPAIERQAFTSISATFTEGDYKEEIDPKAMFTANITDPEATEIVIEVPWFYPEETDNLTSINRMRLRASLDNNCSISPELSVVDLTKDNVYTLTYPNGERREITIRGEIYKLRSANITYFTVENEERGQMITGSIDDESNEVKLYVPNPDEEDLSDMTIDMSISPHATLDQDYKDKTFDFNNPVEITVIAHDGVTKKTYTVKKAKAVKVSYGYVAESARAVWKVNPTAQGLTWGTGQTTLAAIGNHLIVSNGDASTPIYLNRMTGKKLGTINLGSAIATGSVANDDSENLLIANATGAGETLNIYTTTSTRTAPSLLLSYVNKTGYPISRITARGDIKGDAQIVATCDGAEGAASSQIVRWIITGGVIGEPEVVNFSGVQAWGSGVNNTQATPLSINPTDGYFTAAYSSNTVYLVNGKTNAGTATVADGSGNSWAMNLNRLDVRMFNNARYLAVGSISHFPQWGIKGLAFLYDVTSTSMLTGDVATSPALSYSATLDSNLASGDGISANGDILLVPSSNGFYLHMYCWDNNNKIIEAHSFDCIER